MVVTMLHYTFKFYANVTQMRKRTATRHNKLVKAILIFSLLYTNKNSFRILQTQKGYKLAKSGGGTFSFFFVVYYIRKQYCYDLRIIKIEKIGWQK